MQRGAQDFLLWYKHQLRTCRNEGTSQASSDQGNQPDQSNSSFMQRRFRRKVMPVRQASAGLVTLGRDSFRISVPQPVQPKLAVKTYLQVCDSSLLLYDCLLA